jgi:hypothetical protein
MHSIIPTSSLLQVEKTTNRVGNNCNPTPTKLPDVIDDEAKAVCSTKSTTMQVEKNSSKKRAANKQTQLQRK